MTDKKKPPLVENPAEGKKTYQPPKGQKKTWSWKANGQSMSGSVEADWLLIRKKEKPVADIFYTYYSCKADKKPRPITFIFNGGPGASSAYLHVGAVGPKAVEFGTKGECLAPPARLKNNAESWCDFTDIVFVDPVGTGFSRSLEEVDLTPPGREKKGKEDSKVSGQEFYKMNKDLEIIGEFIQRFLSKYRRWSSPVFIAGESYGGFRVAKLSRKLQEDFGVGLCGVILISPCVELNTLSYSDYDILHWVESFPTMTASAIYHRRSPYFSGKEKQIEPGGDLRSLLRSAEDFAVNEMSGFLVQGDRMEAEKRKAILQKIADFTGVSFDDIRVGNARLSITQFCRLLLKNERKWCGLYDTSVTAYDPFPNREQFEGADPTLEGIERVFSHGINTLLREVMELDCDREYRLLNLEVNKSWKWDKQTHFFDLQIGSADDLRYAMAMNPQMKVFICHGVFDLATPYFSSERIIRLMNLPESLKKQISLQVFHGGHMFYTWEHSRRLFKTHIQKLYHQS